MTKQTKHRIRKAVMFARGFFLVLCAILMFLCGSSEHIPTAIVLFVGAALCFGISFLCDYLLGGYKSPFYY